MRKTEVKMNKPIYLGQAIIDISKTLMFEFWYDYIKPKYGDNAKTMLYGCRLLCYINIKTEDLLISKLKIFIKIFLMMLLDGLIHQIMTKKMKDLYQQI